MKSSTKFENIFPLAVTYEDIPNIEPNIGDILVYRPPGEKNFRTLWRTSWSTFSRFSHSVSSWTYELTHLRTLLFVWSQKLAKIPQCCVTPSTCAARGKIFLTLVIYTGRYAFASFNESIVQLDKTTLMWGSLPNLTPNFLHLPPRREFRGDNAISVPCGCHINILWVWANSQQKFEKITFSKL